MAFKPFEPKGEVARWVPIYERLKTLGIGEMITYAELSELAGVDITQDRSPFVRAQKELLEENQRAMVNVKDEGYAVAHPSSQSDLARFQTKKAKRRLKAAIGLLANTDFNYLTPQQQQFNAAMAESLQANLDMTSRLAKKTDRLEETLKTVRRETKADMASLSERMERLEKTLLGQESEQVAE